MIFLIALPILGQSPHGNSLTIDCAQCHNPDGWEVNLSTIEFDHSSTDFELDGTHQITDCKSCHTSFVFNEVPTDCISCHADVHSQSVGNDCMRCHTSDNWLVFNTPEMHEENGFPLIGVHSNLSCVECHSNESSLIFNRIGNECIECHRDDYLATSSPNHIGAGFGEDCLECHNPMGFGWDATGILHDFFPLTMGHDIQDCSQCHDVSNFSDISADCFACHEDDYTSANDPDHQAANFPTDCVACHTTNPGWMPATFDHDGMYFPIYSGSHEDEWNSCTDCHMNPSNYAIFTCLNCHDQGDTDNDHDDVNGYVYESNACFQCHPSGD